MKGGIEYLFKSLVWFDLLFNSLTIMPINQSVMDFAIGLDVRGPNSSVKDMNCWTTYTKDLFIVEPAILPVL